MADILIREVNGIEEEYISSRLLKEQIERAYQAGLSAGMRVDFHCISPMNGTSVNNLCNEFWNKVHQEYVKRYEQGEVVTIPSRENEYDIPVNGMCKDLRHFINTYKQEK